MSKEDTPIFDKCENGRRYSNEMMSDRDFFEKQINKDISESHKQEQILEFLEKRKRETETDE